MICTWFQSRLFPSTILEHKSQHPHSRNIVLLSGGWQVIKSTEIERSVMLWGWTPQLTEGLEGGWVVKIGWLCSELLFLNSLKVNTEKIISEPAWDWFTRRVYNTGVITICVGGCCFCPQMSPCRTGRVEIPLPGEQTWIPTYLLMTSCRQKPGTETLLTSACWYGSCWEPQSWVIIHYLLAEGCAAPNVLQHLSDHK